MQAAADFQGSKDSKLEKIPRLSIPALVRLAAVSFSLFLHGREL